MTRRILSLFFAMLAVASLSGRPDRGRSPDATYGVDLGPVAGFVANAGQWPAEVQFAASRQQSWLAVTDRSLVVGEGDAAASLWPRTVDPAPPIGRQRQTTRCNFLIGEDPRRHASGVEVYAEVTQLLAPGVHWRLRHAAEEGFAYDLLVDEGVAELPIVDVVGCLDLRLAPATGALQIVTSRGVLQQSPPVAWRTVAGERVAVDCSFVITGPASFGFAVDLAADGALCIDPDLHWQAAVGGSLHTDRGFAVAVADDGDVFVAGSTLASNLATTPGVVGPSYSGTATVPQQIGDGFVARLDAIDGSLIWCTYLGGSANDRITEAGASGGEVIVSGWTTSLDFPTTPGAFSTVHNGIGDGAIYLGGDVFVTRLRADGTQLVWSSFLGGSQLEYPLSMAVTPTGEVWVSGHVHSPNFPTTPNAWSATRNGFSDMFVSRFAADGSTLLASTYFGGGSGEEYPNAMALAPNGSVVVAGATDSADLPVTAGALGTTFQGGTSHFADGFFARFDSGLTTLEVGSFLGTPSNERVYGAVVHDDATMTFTGRIDGPGLPTNGSVAGPLPFGGVDGFAWRVAADGSQTLWASYLGGAADDELFRAARLGGGRVAVVGHTRSTNIAHTVGSAGPSHQGGSDGWLVRLAADGGLDYSTAIGGSAYDSVLDVVDKPDGSLALVGTTYGGTFATTPGAPTYQGFGDAFCSQVRALPNGVARIGTPSGTCGSTARMQTRSHPAVGNAQFALSAGTIPPTSPTLLAFSTQTLATPLPVLGFSLWVDPTGLLSSVAVVVDGFGTATFDLPIPANAAVAGAALAAQFVWLDACPAPGFQGSDALTIVVQP